MCVIVCACEWGWVGRPAQAIWLRVKSRKVTSRGHVINWDATYRAPFKKKNKETWACTTSCNKSPPQELHSVTFHCPFGQTAISHHLRCNLRSPSVSATPGQNANCWEVDRESPSWTMSVISTNLWGISSQNRHKKGQKNTKISKRCTSE